MIVRYRIVGPKTKQQEKRHKLSFPSPVVNIYRTKIDHYQGDKNSQLLQINIDRREEVEDLILLLTILKLIVKYVVLSKTAFLRKK